MRNKRPTGRKKRRVFRKILSLLLLATVGAGAWTYLKPYLTASSITNYASYTVGRGDIATTKSFSATLSVGDSETLYNTTGAESIKKLYVTGGQEVKEGDVLMELSDGTVLEAGLDGVVNEIRYAEGDWLRGNTQLVQVCDLTNLQVSLQIDEYDVEQVSVGQKCTIMIVPLNREFETELTHVSRLSTATGRVAYYSATAELVVPEEVLPGMTASVTIADESVEDVLTLDMAALSFDEDGEPYVLKKNGETYEQVSVETGLSDGMKVEIVSGLSEGEEVWVVTGTQEVESSFSIGDIYRKIFGTKVVINEDRSSGQGGGRGNAGKGFGSGEMDLTNMELPDANDGTDFTFPEGMTVPEGMELPEGMEMPDGRGMATGTDMAFPGGQRPQGDQGGFGRDGGMNGGKGGFGQKPGAGEDTEQQGSDGE